MKVALTVLACLAVPGLTAQVCPYDARCLNNPYGAGSAYKADGINDPYSQYGSRYSDKSANNPYATNAPKLYDSQGNYRGRLNNNPYDPDSTSNPYGRYRSRSTRRKASTIRTAQGTPMDNR